MARKPRVLSDLGFYHVIMRGNNQQSIFYDKMDRKFFKQRLKKYADELGIKVYSYTLMNNHIHLELGNATQYMGLLIKKLACSYVPYFNKKYKRTGHLFHSRYFSEPIYDVEYFMNTAGYIINNPELAGFCKHNEYEWSSYNEYFVPKRKNHIVDKDYLINIAGSETKLKLFFLNGWNKKSLFPSCKKNYSDETVILFINQLFGINNPLEITHSKNNRNSMIKQLVKIGLPIKQLSRILGISKGLIYKLT